MKRALLGALALTSSLSFASDRIIDLSSRCKVYQLQDKAWRETDAAGFTGMKLSNDQIVRDEKFTVFRTGEGTFGLNQRCVKGGFSSSGSPVSRRKSAAKPQIEEPSSLDGRGRWAATFSLGMNLSPKGTIVNTTGTTSTTAKNTFSNSVAFVGSVSYRLSQGLRLASDIGISQLQNNASVGNEISFFNVNPEWVFRIGENTEFYIGPTVGFFFFSQNASTVTVSGTTTTFKQQTPTSLLLGGVIGSDYALSPQYDLGLCVRYFKPGALTITGTQTAPTAADISSTLTTSYLMVGGRFVIHF